MRQSIPVSGGGLGLGDHVAFFFKNNAERFAFVTPYVLKGLQNNERCVYVAHENTVEDIRSHFKAVGVDLDGPSGALSIVTAHDTYLRDGIFEPNQMIDNFDREVRLALARGFSGLRVTGEMSWALDLPSAFGSLCEYEDRLSRRWPTELAGLCQYNEPLFPIEVVAKMPGWHCTVVRDGNISREHVHNHQRIRLLSPNLEPSLAILRRIGYSVGDVTVADGEPSVVIDGKPRTCEEVFQFVESYINRKTA